MGLGSLGGLDVCVGGAAYDVIRKEAWSFYRTSSGVRLCWELEEPKGPKGLCARLRACRPDACVCLVVQGPRGRGYRGTSLMRNTPPLGSPQVPSQRASVGSYGGGGVV